MNCSNCATDNADAARFCSSCGAELQKLGAFASRVATEKEITRRQPGRSSQEATLVDDGSDRLLGSTIAGRYRIDGKLGAGGMGVVYRATRLLIGDEVAVKILHSEQSDPKAAERFRREAQAAARLKHQNAVVIYDFGVTDDGLQYLVMELVEGQSLRRIIKQQGPLSPSPSAEIVNQVCAALDEAHRHNIIHRDIKPDNILVDATTNGLHVKVLDFGIAKLRDLKATNITLEGSVMGTPHYMSPEQCLGQELDLRSDIYSLGVVLYEMLAGTVPFNSSTLPAVVVQHVNQAPPSLRAMNISISESVEQIVFNALEKSPDLRPQTAGELARKFNAAINQPLRGHFKPQTQEPFPPTGEITPPTTFPTGLPVTVVLPKTAGALTMNSPSGAERDNSKTILIAIGLLAVALVGVVFYLLLRNNNESPVLTERSASTVTTTATQTPQPTSKLTPATANAPPAQQFSAPTPNANRTELRHAWTKYSGVNIRSLPNRDSTLIATLGSGEELLVLGDSNNVDTVYIKSAGRSFTDNWSEVQLAANPAVHGWVFNGFITKK